MNRAARVLLAFALASSAGCASVMRDLNKPQPTANVSLTNADINKPQVTQKAPDDPIGKAMGDLNKPMPTPKMVVPPAKSATKPAASSTPPTAK